MHKSVLDGNKGYENNKAGDMPQLWRRRPEKDREGLFEEETLEWGLSDMKELLGETASEQAGRARRGGEQVVYLSPFWLVVVSASQIKSRKFFFQQLFSVFRVKVLHFCEIYS